MGVMNGLSCGNCGRGNGPWITAYQIALKHGFKGTEAQWIKSIGTMRVANVTGISGGTFTCDTSLGQIRQGMEDGYLTALVYMGIPAFVVDVQDDYVSWATNLLRDEDGDFYYLYTMSGRSNTMDRMDISGSGEGGGIGNKSVHLRNLDDDLQESVGLANSAVQPEDVPVVKGYASMADYLADAANVRVGDYVLITETNAKLYRKTETENSTVLTLIYTFPAGSGGEIPDGSITINKLNNELQGSIVKAESAIQPGDLAPYITKAAQGVKTVNDTQEVHIDSNGKLWTQPGGGDDPSVESVTQLITMDYYDGDIYASQNAAQIYDTLDEGNANLVLIDRSGRECYLVHKPEDDSGDTCVAKFATFDVSSEEIIVYSISANGIVTSATVRVDELPVIGNGDDGKVLTVVSGLAAWAAIPETTTSEIDAIIAAI